MKQAETGLAARLAGDAALVALVGTDEQSEARIYYGWPSELLEKPSEDEFPRVTFFMPTDRPIRPEVGRVTIQLDIWVWPEGTNGGKARLDDIDERIRDLLDEQWWAHDGKRLSGTAGPGRDFPAGPGVPLRRMRPVTILVN